MNDPPMTLSRFRWLVAAYGSELSRWPAGERDAAEALLRVSEPAQAALGDEVELDDALNALNAPDVSATLARRLNEIPVRTPEKQRARFPLRRLWVPAFGWAAAAALGFALGNFADDGDDALSDASRVVDQTSSETAPSDDALASLALGFADLEETQ